MIELLPAAADPCAGIAGRIVAHHREELPDLSRVVVVLPGHAAAGTVRERLLDAAARHGHCALLGPNITTLREWAVRQTPPPRPVPGGHAGELILVEALHGHRRLFGRADPWHLADELLALFRELTLAGTELPGGEEEFVALLARGYGSPATLEPLRREARLVHTIWRAWHEQLAAEGLIDADAAYLEALRRIAEKPPPGLHLWLAGHDDLHPAEAAFVAALGRRGMASIVLHGTAAGRSGRALADLAGRLGGAPLPPPRPPPQGEGDAGGDGYSAFLAAALDAEEPGPRERAAWLAAELPESPAAGRLSICTLADAEEQALAVDAQLRIWLTAGVGPVAVVCDDRRLARRLRALLERAGVALNDPTGWALSTTSAAAALERWLEAVEEDFTHHPLLDVLKSPFASVGTAGTDGLDAVHRLERDVIRHEQIPRNLERMREHLRLRRRRLGTVWAEEERRAVADLLDTVADAAAPLRAVCDARPRPPTAFLDALAESMELLGMAAGFAADHAGSRILEELAAMRADAAERPLRMVWGEARAWLGRVLETRYFLPPAARGQIDLLSLEQTAFACYGGIVVAGADAGRLPGSGGQAAFFNDAVRADLGLATRSGRTALRLARFRRLLEAAPRIVITMERERDGEQLAPSPWVEALETIHRLAWGDGPGDDHLAAIAASNGAAVPPPEGYPLPPAEEMPRPHVPARLVPERLSASGHQDLIDCPYRFFAARCLRLAPPEEIVETLRKSEYGSRIHLCLSAFHGGEEGLPGPFTGPLTGEAREAATALLEEVSAAVFARDIEDNFVHRAWLARWRRLIPAYIDWAIGRAADWQVERTEAAGEARLAADLLLHGRLDRIDRGAEGRAVIDYKTGATVARLDDVLSGESVQLPTYALLAEGVRQVEYLIIGDKGVRPGAVVADAALADLADGVRDRLIGVMAQVRAGAPLPAWGDEAVCRHCAMGAVCRHDAWAE